MSKSIDECVQLFFTNLYNVTKMNAKQYKYILRNYQDELRKIPLILDIDLKNRLFEYGLNQDISSSKLHEVCVCVARELFKNPALVYDGVNQKTMDNNNVIFLNIISSFTSKICDKDKVDEICENHSIEENNTVHVNDNISINTIEICTDSNDKSSTNDIVEIDNHKTSTNDIAEEDDNDNDVDVTDIDNTDNSDEEIYELMKLNPVCEESSAQPTENYDYLMSIKYNNKYAKSCKSSVLSRSSLKSSKLYKQIEKKYFHAYK